VGGALEMLYLAQVSPRNGFFFRKKELKLLARLGSGMIWHHLHYGRTLRSTEANSFNVGTLVIAEVKDDQQVIEVREATQVVLHTLTNTSLLQKKLREHQQEIDDWKSSLVYQTQILNQRKLAIEKQLVDICPEDIEELLDDLRQVYYQHFQVTSASKKMVLFEDDMEKARRQLESTLALSNDQR
jgi:hypothetical protein